MSIKLGIHGAGGRMGRRLMALATADAELELAGAVDYAGHPMQGKKVSDFEPETADSSVILAKEFDSGIQAVIDFSLPEGTEALLGNLPEGTALVIGTTGLSDEQAKMIEESAKTRAIVWAPNMSLGVNLMFRVAAEIAKVLGDDYNIEITEAHHNRKADAPSGTAMGLAKSVCEALGRDIAKDLVHGRSGRPGPRTVKEIGMHALRMGSVVGDHTVHYGNDVERIELTHRAETRDVFANGALRAAKWVSSMKPGLYDMQDVLFG